MRNEIISKIFYLSNNYIGNLEELSELIPYLAELPITLKIFLLNLKYFYQIYFIIFLDFKNIFSNNSLEKKGL